MEYGDCRSRCSAGEPSASGCCYVGRRLRCTGWLAGPLSGPPEVADILEHGFARALLDSGIVLGWIGGLPEYGGRVWELHPIVVQRGHRRQGLGLALVEVFQVETVRRGALTVTLGTDDVSGMTSL